MPTISVTIRSPYWRMSRRKGGRTRSGLLSSETRSSRPMTTCWASASGPADRSMRRTSVKGITTRASTKTRPRPLGARLPLSAFAWPRSFSTGDQKGSRFAGYQRPPMTSIRPRVPLTSMSVTAYSVTTSTSISYLRLSRSRKYEIEVVQHHPVRRAVVTQVPDHCALGVVDGLTAADDVSHRLTRPPPPPLELGPPPAVNRYTPP